MPRLPKMVHSSVAWLVNHAPTGHPFLLRVYDSVLIRIGGSFRCRTYFGAEMICDRRDLVPSRVIYFGIWEPNISAIFELLLREGDVVVDIGANVGYDSLLAARLVGPTGKVVSIEASPRIFKTLISNVKLNPDLSIECLNIAASDRHEVISLYQGPVSNTGITTTVASRGLSFECSVQAKPMVDVLDSEQRSRVRLIKIDIEGGEVPVIRHLLETIDLYPESLAIIVEISPDEEWRELFDRLRTEGFHAYWIENSYDRSYYIAHHRDFRQPKLISSVPDEQADVLFTREPFETLELPLVANWRRRRRRLSGPKGRR